MKPGVVADIAGGLHIFAHELIKSKGLIDHLDRPQDLRLVFVSTLLVRTDPRRNSDRGDQQAARSPACMMRLMPIAAGGRRIFRNAGRLLFNSEEKWSRAAFVRPRPLDKAIIIGEGVEVATRQNASALLQMVPARPSDRFPLYFGRKDPGKNVPLLMEAFARFRAVRPTPPFG